jgi:hypothetical protein
MPGRRSRVVEGRQALRLLVDFPAHRPREVLERLGHDLAVRVPPGAATRPSTRKVGTDCGMRVWEPFSRCSAGRIRARVACPSRSAASKVDRNRTGAGVSAAGRGRAAGRAARRRPDPGTGAASSAAVRRGASPIVQPAYRETPFADTGPNPRRQRVTSSSWAGSSATGRVSRPPASPYTCARGRGRSCRRSAQP